MVAGRPPSDIVRPAILDGLARGAATEPVWANDLGGLTFAIGRPPTRYLKWQPLRCGIDLDAEVARLAWAGAYTCVPRVLERSADSTGEWLVTEAVDGSSAVDERWLREPEVSVRAIAVGLRHLHDTLPVGACPFTWSVPDRLAHLQDAHRWRHEVLSVPPPVDGLVVCHGDPCAPNTLLDDRGGFVGHVDLGSLGVADRWADLAVASMSLGWNYGPGWEPCFFDSYGIEADADRISYYRLLWDCT